MTKQLLNPFTKLKTNEITDQNDSYVEPNMPASNKTPSNELNSQELNDLHAELDLTALTPSQPSEFMHTPNTLLDNSSIGTPVASSTPLKLPIQSSPQPNYGGAGKCP